MTILSGLNFDTRDAACYSLRVLAEKVRAGDLNIKLFDIRPEVGTARIDFVDPRKKNPRP